MPALLVDLPDGTFECGKVWSVVRILRPAFRHQFDNLFVGGALVYCGPEDTTTSGPSNCTPTAIGYDARIDAADANAATTGGTGDTTGILYRWRRRRRRLLAVGGGCGGGVGGAARTPPPNSLDDLCKKKR